MGSEFGVKESTALVRSIELLLKVLEVKVVRLEIDEVMRNELMFPQFLPILRSFRVCRWSIEVFRKRLEHLLLLNVFDDLECLLPCQSYEERPSSFPRCLPRLPNSIIRILMSSTWSSRLSQDHLLPSFRVLSSSGHRLSFCSSLELETRVENAMSNLVTER